METLEINVENAKESDDLLLDGVATQIECDDEGLSPARENVKFFSQASISSRSISTEKSAHDVDRSKHFQKLGSAAFVGMEGISSPNPNGGGRGGRGIPVRRRTFHSAPTGSNTNDDTESGSIQNAAAAATAFLNMPPPRARQNNAPVTPSVTPAGQSVLPESDQKTDTEAPNQRRPSSMFVRRSIVESLFGNDEAESSNSGRNDINKEDKQDENNEITIENNNNTNSSEDEALAAATAAATLYNASHNISLYNNAQTPVDATPVVDTRSSSDNSMYHQIVRTVSSVAEEGGLNFPTQSEESVTVLSATDDSAACEVDSKEPLAYVETSDNVLSSDVQDETQLNPIANNNNVTSETPVETSTDSKNTINNIDTTTATPTAHSTNDQTSTSIYTIQPPGPNKNPAKFIAPTYVQHPVSYLKVGKGTVNISTSVSATANINAGKSKTGSTSSSSNVSYNVDSDRVNSETTATNAEKAKAMVSVGSVKDRIKKFETLKSDTTDNSNHTGDGKKAPHRRASLS